MTTSRTFHISHNESNGEISLPLTTVVLIPDSTSPVSIIPSLEPINKVTNKNELNQPLLGRRRSTRKISMADVSRRLIKRKVLHIRLCLISNIMFCLALLGVIFMIIENEITFMNVYHKQTIVSFVIKTIISITTICLIGFVFYYNYLRLCLYVVNNLLDDWRVGLTQRKIFLIFLEVLICSIHPVPRYFPFISNIKPNNSTITHPIPLSHIDIDVALGLPMFARLYLLCRFFMYHSHLVHDASSQSLGYLNRVTIDFFFLIKTYLEQWPTRSLLMFSIFSFVIGSWSLRACNYTSTAEHLSILDSMWLFVVTFTTVGYGDLTPSTYCGRSIAGLIGLLGILSTALLISVLAQKLELSRSEKYVHNFVLNIEMAKQRKHQAANVVKFALKVWYLKQKHQRTSSVFIKAQRGLYRSIHFNKQLKQEQKQLVDNCVGFPELITVQRETNTKTKENAQRSTIMESKVDKLEEKLVDMNRTMMNIESTLNLMLSKMPQ